MSVKVTPVFANYMLEFIAEWTVEKLQNGVECGKIPSFYPVEGDDLKLRLEIDNGTPLTFNLVKIQAEDNPSLKMKVCLSIYAMDGSDFFQYPSSAAISVDKLNKLTFTNDFYPFPAFQQATGFVDMVVRCRILFFEYSLMRPIACKPKLTSSVDCLTDDFSILGDVEIGVGKKSLFAHESLLFLHSSVLKKNITEHNYDARTILYVGDISTTFPVFDCFLGYLYSGEIQDKSWSVVRNLYNLAHEYKVETLKNDCAVIVISFLSADTVKREIPLICEILKLAYDCKDEFLKEKAMACAFQNIKELLGLKEWDNLISEYPTIANDILKKTYSVN